MILYDDSRADWGADRNTNPQAVSALSRVGISWHYPGGALSITPASPHSACLHQVKAWQTFHQDGRGWADIGYNLLICQHARVIEGRGADLVGAHSPGVNVEHYGVQIMTSNDTPPTAAMLARAVNLRAVLEYRSNRRLRQWGHQDDPKAATECPGPAIEAWVKAGGPYATTTPTQEDDDMYTDKDRARDDAIAARMPKILDDADGQYLVDQFAWQNRQAAVMAGQVAALTAAVGQLAGGQGVDLGAITDAAHAGAAAALEELIDSATTTSSTTLNVTQN